MRRLSVGTTAVALSVALLVGVVSTSASAAHRNNPVRYIDRTGRVAITVEESAEGAFVFDGTRVDFALPVPSVLPGPQRVSPFFERLSAISARIERLRSVLLPPNPCLIGRSSASCTLLDVIDRLPDGAGGRAVRADVTLTGLPRAAFGRSPSSLAWFIARGNRVLGNLIGTDLLPPNPCVIRGGSSASCALTDLIETTFVRLADNTSVKTKGGFMVLGETIRRLLDNPQGATAPPPPPPPPPPPRGGGGTQQMPISRDTNATSSDRVQGNFIGTSAAGVVTELPAPVARVVPTPALPVVVRAPSTPPQQDMLVLQQALEQKNELESMISNVMEAGTEGGQAGIQRLKDS